MTTNNTNDAGHQLLGKTLAARASYPYKAREQIEQLWFYGCTQAVSMMLLAQVIYLNLHYIVGASLTVVALCSLVVQQFLSFYENYWLRRDNRCAMYAAMDAHFWVTRVFALLYVPLVVWAVVIMYEREPVP